MDVDANGVLWYMTFVVLFYAECNVGVVWCMAKFQLLFFLMHYLVLVKFVYGKGGVQFLHTNANVLHARGY